MKVLNFGSLNIDYVYQVDHTVQPGETLASEGRNVFLGGKGFNQSVALAKAGVPVYHAGLIGEGGEIFFEKCKEYNVNSTYIKLVEGMNGHTIIQVDKNGQNCILLFGGSNQKISKPFVDEVLAGFEKGDILLLQNEINELPYIIDKAYELGMMIVLNPSPYNKRLEECDLRKVSVFLINEVEGEQMTGSKEADIMIDTLQKKYIEAKIVLTLGENGVVYAGKDQTMKQAAVKVDVVDTTAAGDTFTGYFIAGILTDMDIEENLRRCVKASAIAVSKPGAADSIPTIEEVNSLS